MIKVPISLTALVFGCLAVVSCEPEAESQAEEEPLTLQDLANPELEKAAAEESETIDGARKKRDEINAKTKAREERVKELGKILGQ